MSGNARLPRFRRDGAAIRTIKLTARDQEIIRLVGRYRFLRSTHLLRLVGGGRRQILRRLQALYHHGWLDRPRCQIDYYHHGGSQPMAYCLGSRGAALMRREFDVPFSRLVWSRKSGAVNRVFLDHALMTSGILIEAEQASTAAGWSYLSQEAMGSETAAATPFRWKSRTGEKEAVVVPDAVFVIESATADSRIVCCVEADRGTMPIERRSLRLSSIRRKLLGYAEFWAGGNFHAQFRTKRLAVLLITTTPERRKAMESAINKIPRGRGIFNCFAEAEFAERFGERLAEWSRSGRDLSGRRQQC